MTPCHASPYSGLSPIGHTSTQHPRAARWRFEWHPPKKLHSARTTVTPFHLQPLSAFKTLYPDSIFNFIVPVFTGCDPLPEVKLSFFHPLQLFFRLFRVVYTAISQFDTFPTRPSLSATTHTLPLALIANNRHTYISRVAVQLNFPFFFFGGAPALSTSYPLRAQFILPSFLNGRDR